MLDKIKAIKNYCAVKAENCKFCAFCQNVCGIYMKILNKIAKRCYKLGISANVVTIVGFAFGLLVVNFVSLNMYGYAILFILINRFFDSLDGAIARQAGVTDFGVFLDASLDYTFYGAVIFAFALVNPEQNGVAASFLLFAFLTAGCAMLSYAVIAYKKDKKRPQINHSPFYLGGFMQGFETLLALLIICIFPFWFMQIAIILGILSLVKAVGIMVGAYYSFEISERAGKSE